MDRDAVRQKRALSLFEQAVAIDPNNALAWARIGHCYASLGGDYGTEDPKVTRPKARAAIAKALELDPELPEAYIASGWLKMFDWDKEGAERDFRRAIELSPNNSEAHRRYAFFLRDRRRFDEAIAEDKRAIDLAPLDIMPQTLLSLIYGEAGLVDKQIEQIHRVLELDPNYRTTYLLLGNAYAKKGQWSDAISSYEKVKETDPLGYLSGVAWIWAMSDNRTEATRAKSELLEFAKHNHVSPYYFANYEARFGDREAAFKWLEKAYDERDPGIVDLDQEDNFAQMRSDPRFKSLQRRVAHERENSVAP
jgi:tetratricopeptide (TPR) repeat protein